MLNVMFSNMFLHIFGAKYIFMTYFFILVASGPTEIEVKEKSSIEILEEYTEKLNKEIKLQEICMLVNLQVWIYPNEDAKIIKVSFNYTDSRFRNCFKFFDIFLKVKGKEVYAAKIPYDYNIKEKASHVFENVACGSYELIIEPCYNSWKCAPIVVRYPTLLNMSSTDCFEKPKANSLNSPDIQSQNFEQTVLLILTVSGVIAILIVGGLLYYRYKSALKTGEQKEHSTIENGIKPLRNTKDPARYVKVFIINHYDDKTLKRVECLTEFLSFIPNLKFECSEDGLAVISIEGISGWLNEKLERSKVDGDDKTIRKIIIIDSKEEMQAKVNENENRIFYEAIKKLSEDWEKNMDDYDNLFVVHFNSSLTKQNELKNIVTRARYGIPDHAFRLCRDLVYGSNIVLCDDVTENLINYRWNIP